jgi:hypothetical protein
MNMRSDRVKKLKVTTHSINYLCNCKAHSYFNAKEGQRGARLLDRSSGALSHGVPWSLALTAAARRYSFSGD